MKQMSYDYLDELEFLLDTAGAVPDKRFVQKLSMPDSRTFVGTGKLEEIAEYVKAAGIDVAVFDDELNGSQTRNIERALGCRVLDRPLLILDIFAKRARTTVQGLGRAGAIPVSPARLTRMWTHLEKQRGGSVCAARVKKRSRPTGVSSGIDQPVEEKLKDIDKQKVTQRKSREELIRVAWWAIPMREKHKQNMLSKSDVFAGISSLPHWILPSGKW
jgi:GTP-binding protein HflX